MKCDIGKVETDQRRQCWNQETGKDALTNSREDAGEQGSNVKSLFRIESHCKRLEKEIVYNRIVMTRGMQCVGWASVCVSEWRL